MSSSNNIKNIKRRTFLKKLWIGLGIVAGLEIIYMIFSFLSPKTRKSTIENNFLLEIGNADDFIADTVVDFKNRGFFVSRKKDGSFIVLSSKCTHLGCALDYNKNQNRFECPCHSSLFSLDGKVLRSPASKDLPRHRVVVEKGIVKVDLSKTIS